MWLQMLLEMLGNISCTSWTTDFMRKDWKEKVETSASGADKKLIRIRMLAFNPVSVRKNTYAIPERRTLKILERFRCP